MAETCNCPEINDAEWEGKTFDWKGKAFYEKSLPCVFGIPLGIGTKIAKAFEEMKAKGYKPASPAMVMTNDALFRQKVMISIEPPEKLDPSVEVFPQSEIHASVYKGTCYNPMPGVKAFSAKLKSDGKPAPSKWYFWYATCPVCSTRRGYKIVLFARTK